METVKMMIISKSQIFAKYVINNLNFKDLFCEEMVLFSHKIQQRRSDT